MFSPHLKFKLPCTFYLLSCIVSQPASQKLSCQLIVRLIKIPALYLPGTYRRPLSPAKTSISFLVVSLLHHRSISHIQKSSRDFDFTHYEAFSFKLFSAISKELSFLTTNLILTEILAEHRFLLQQLETIIAHT